jgi:nitrous oxidase accessory protein NosD
MNVTLSLFAGAGAQFLDNAGNVLTGGKIYTYAAGTTTPLATYTTASDAAFHTNPIILDASGRVPSGGEIWLNVGQGYKFVVKDANDVLIATYDNIPSAAQPPAANDADSIMYEQGYLVTAGSFVAGTTYRIVSVGTTNFTLIGAVANISGIHFIATGAGTGTGTAELSQTVQTKLQETISVKDFGAVGNGVADDSAAIQAAEDYASANKRNVYFPSGVYLCGTTIYRKGNTDWHGEGMYLSVLKHTGGLDTHEIIYTDNLDADYSHIGFYNMGFDGNRSGSVDPDTRRETVFLDRNAFGGDIAPSKDVRFIGCRIFNYSFNGHGLHIKGYTGVQIKDSIFEDGGGNVLFHPVYLLRAADVAITENVVIARTDSVCIKVQRGTQVVVANNIVRDGSRGVFIQDGNQSAITGNSILDCVLGVALTTSGDGPDTKTTVVGNVIDGSETGVLVSGQTFGVISDNLITEFSSYGISLRASQEFNIVGNMLRTADSGVGNIDFIFLDAGPTQNRAGIIGNFLRNNRTTGTTNGIVTIETVDTGLFVSNNQLISVSPGWTSEFSGLNPILKVERNQGLIVRGANRINNASQLEINGLADVTGNPAYSAYHWGNTNNAPSLLLNKSRSETIGTKGSSVQDNDELGSVVFLGDHNDAFLSGVKIVASVDGVPTPGSDSMPARLIFQTRSSAGGAPQTRLTINSDGRIIPVLPTSSAGLPSGALWNDGGTVKVA